MKKLFCLVLIIFLAAGSSGLPAAVSALSADDFTVIGDIDPEESERYDYWARTLLNDMSLEEKVCQLFLICPEALTGDSHVLTCSDDLAAALRGYPVGGLLFYSRNMESEAQCAALLSDIQAVYERKKMPVPFLAVTDEGGLVSPMSVKTGQDLLPAAATLGESGSAEEAYQTGSLVAERLSQTGFQMDLAPLCDIPGPDYRQEIPGRLFSTDPSTTAKLATAWLEGLQASGVIGVMKHFPGNGSVKASRTIGTNMIRHSLDTLRSEDLLPYRYAYEKDALQAVLVSNLPAVYTGDRVPCVFSKAVIEDLLRSEMGFDGVVITDQLDAGYLSSSYSSAKACVLALNAGADLLMTPASFIKAYEGILEAVRTGRLSEDRIDESVLRILKLKIRFGLID